MKIDRKTIIWIVSAAAFVATAVSLAIVFRKQICEFCGNIKTKLFGSKPNFTPEEVEDFADI